MISNEVYIKLKLNKEAYQTNQAEHRTTNHTTCSYTTSTRKATHTCTRCNQANRPHRTTLNTRGQSTASTTWRHNSSSSSHNLSNSNSNRLLLALRPHLISTTPPPQQPINKQLPPLRPLLRAAPIRTPLPALHL